MANTNQNSGDNRNDNEQPEGWFDPQTYRQNLERRNEQGRSNYQQTTNPNMNRRNEDINRQRFQNEYNNDRDGVNRQFGNQHGYGDRSNEQYRNRGNERSTPYGDNFEHNQRNTDDHGYRSNRAGNSGNNYGNRSGNDNRGDDRDWLDRASDEVASWFGNDEAESRRRADKLQGPHSGKGPKGYTRSDERVKEDINERLYHDSYIDASDVDITVQNGEVTLTGTVDTREAKRRIEDIIASMPGIRDVENRLKVQQGSGYSSGNKMSDSSGRV